METRLDRIRSEIAQGEERIEAARLRITQLRDQDIDATAAAQALDEMKSANLALRDELAREELRATRG